MEKAEIKKTRSKFTSKKFWYDSFIGFLTVIGVLTPFVFYYFITAKPFQKVWVNIDTYTINNNFNSIDIYNSTHQTTRISKVIGPYLDYRRNPNYNRYASEMNRTDSPGVPIPRSPYNDSLIILTGLSREILDSISKEPVKDLKLGRYELRVTIINKSKTTFTNPTLNIISDYVYMMLERNGGYSNADTAFKKITGHKIVLGEYLRPKQTIAFSLLTKDNEKAEVRDGAIYIQSSFPEIFFSIDDKLITPNYSTLITFSGNIDKKLTWFVINHPFVQLLIFGFTLIGLFFSIKIISRKVIKYRKSLSQIN